MHDEYYISIYTGEILPGTKAIATYYNEKKRGYLDAWTDEWKPTGQECPNDYITPPDFAKAVKRI